MILRPTRRWAVVALLLALAWPLTARAEGGALVAGALVLGWVILLGIDWVLAPDPLQIILEREAPPAFSVGRALPVRFRWRNPTRRRARLEVREAWPAPLHRGPAIPRRVGIAAGGATDEIVTFTPLQRGRAAAGTLWLRSRGPLGLADAMGRQEFPWSALVFPDLSEAAVRALPTRALRRREIGLRNVRRLGEGRIFETLREWVPGDDTRSIDWKATAKRGKVMARQYEDERRQQVLIAIDAGRLLSAEIDGRARLESAIDAALHLAYAAADHDDDVGLFVFADTVQHYLAPRRGRQALKGIVEALATVEGKLVEPDYPTAFAFLAARNRKRALTVCFTDLIDRTASDALVAQLGTLRPRHLPLAVALRDTALERTAVAHAATPAEAFERAAAEELLTARAEGLARIRGRGVLVLDVPPAQAARSVVEQYDQLKRRGLL